MGSFDSMNQSTGEFSRSKRFPTFIFVILIIGLSARLSLFITAKPWLPPNADKLVLRSDSDAIVYNALATTLLNTNYSEFAIEAGGDPEALVTPGYPLFISFFYKFFGERLWIILVFQIVLDVISCAILVIIITQSLGSKEALYAGLFYALDPHLILYSNNLLSDTLFTFLLVCSFYLLGNVVRKGFDREKIIHVSLAALLLGIATLVRSIAQFLPLFLSGFMLVSLRKNIRKGLKFTSIFIVIFILSLSPLLIRNYITFNVLSISSSPDYNILRLYVAPFVAEQQNQDIKIVHNSLRSEVEALMSQDGLDSHEFNRHDFRVTKYYRDLGIKYIRNYPIDFVKHYAIGIVHFFFNLDTRVYAKYLGLPNAEIHIKGHTNVLILMKNWIRQKTLGEKVVGLWISLYLLICYISAIAGIFAGRKNYHKTFLLYSGITILYFVLVTGTAGLARFRLPSIPFYLVFVGIGVVLLEKQLRRL